MKKNIVIGVLLLVCTTLVIFGYIKANDAEKAMMMAQESQMEALKSMDEAMKQQSRALDAAAETKKQEQIALDLAAALAECPSK